MKLLLLFLMVLSHSCFAQVVAVANDKENVVIRGLPSPLTVVAENYTCESIFVTTDNGSIIKTDDCRYELTADSVGMATISVHTVKKKDTIPLSEHRFRVWPIPDPVAKVAGKSSGSINKKVLEAQVGIPASLEIVCGRARVESFTMIAIYKGKTLQLKSKNALFTDEMKQVFRELGSNSVVVFKDIMATTPNGRSRLLNPIVLTIYE